MDAVIRLIEKGLNMDYPTIVLISTLILSVIFFAKSLKFGLTILTLMLTGLTIAFYELKFNYYLPLTLLIVCLILLFMLLFLEREVVSIE